MGEYMTDWEWENRCGCSDKDAEIDRLRAENERYYLLFTKLQDIAGDQRFSDEFVGSSTRWRLKKFAATKGADRD